MSVAEQPTTSTDSTAPLPRSGTTKSRASRHSVVMGLVMAAYVPLLFLLARHLWNRPHYQFFPIVLVGVSALIASRWPSSQSIAADRPRRGETSLLLFGMLLLIAAIAVHSPWLAGVSAIITSAGLLIYLAGTKAFLDQFIGPWCLLWLMIPLPFQLDARLVERLQAMTSSVASSVLELMEIRHLMAGNILELPTRRMFVEEACSGIHSLFAIVACVGLYVAWARRPILHAVLLLASAVFWALVMNMVRVLTVAVAYAWYEIDLATGWIHEALGVVVFVFALLMTASTDQLLSWLGQQRHRRRRPGGDDKEKKNAPPTSLDAAAVSADSTVDVPQQQAGPKRATAWESSTVAALAGGLLLLQLLVWILPGKTENRVSEAAEQLAAESLPAQLNGWEQLDYELTTREITSSFGEFSKTWTYRAPICEAAVSFDYPFEGWHEATRCYRGHGWSVVSRQLNGSSDETTDSPFVEVELTKPSGEHGYLLFGSLTESGAPVQPPRSTTSLKSKIVAKLAGGPLARLFGQTSLADYGLNLNTYQFQTFVVTNHRLSADERTDVRKQFLQFSKLFREQCRQAP